MNMKKLSVSTQILLIGIIIIILVSLFPSSKSMENSYEDKSSYDFSDVNIISNENSEDPLIAIINGPFNAYVNDDIQLEGNATGGIQPYSFHWDFGDGNTSNLQNPIYSYIQPGNYTINLTVTDNESVNATNSTYAVILDVEDTNPPLINYFKPEQAFYINNKKIVDYKMIFVIGDIDIIVNVTDDKSGVDRVKFYLDGILQDTQEVPPFKWTLNEILFFGHCVKVEAFDKEGNRAEESISVFIFNIFPKIKYGLLQGEVVGGLFNLSIPGVKITAESEGFEKFTYTKRIPLVNRGCFNLRLPLGNYIIKAEKDGFVTQYQEVKVTMGDNEYLKFQLDRE